MHDSFEKNFEITIYKVSMKYSQNFIKLASFVNHECTSKNKRVRYDSVTIFHPIWNIINIVNSLIDYQWMEHL